MAGGGGEPAEGKEDLGMSVNNIGKGWGESKGVGGVFQGSISGGTTFGGGDVGDDPPYGPGPGGVPTQGRSTDQRESTHRLLYGIWEYPPLYTDMQ